MRRIIKTKRNTKIMIYNYLLGFFSLSFIVISILVITRDYKSYKNSREAIDVLNAYYALTDVEGSTVNYENIDVKIGKYKVIGSIRIESIGLNYPILEKSDAESLKLSITKLAGPNLNELGNVSIAGHNSNNGTLFSKLASIELDDVIEITDSKNKMIRYKVYKVYSVLPTDLDPIKTVDKNIREITLITCTWNAKKRIIVKAIEI